MPCPYRLKTTTARRPKLSSHKVATVRFGANSSRRCSKVGSEGSCSMPKDWLKTRSPSQKFMSLKSVRALQSIPVIVSRQSWSLILSLRRG